MNLKLFTFLYNYEYEKDRYVYNNGNKPLFHEIHENTIDKYTLDLLLFIKTYYFRNREEIIENKYILIQFLSHLKINVNSKEKEIELMEKDIIASLKKSEKLEKQIDDFLKDL